MSINILALTAVNRYICIVKPGLYPTLFTKKKTLFSILFVLLLTLTALLTATFATPISFQWYPLGLAIEVTGLEVRAGVSKSSIGLVGLVMPLIIFCYGSVYRTIKRHNSVVSPSTRHHKSSESKPARDTSISGSPGDSYRIWSLLDSLPVVRIHKHVYGFSLPSYWWSSSTLFGNGQRSSCYRHN